MKVILTKSSEWAEEDNFLEVSDIADLAKISAQHQCSELILSFKDGQLYRVEIYDDYRE